MLRQHIAAWTTAGFALLLLLLTLSGEGPSAFAATLVLGVVALALFGVSVATEHAALGARGRAR